MGIVAEVVQTVVAAIVVIIIAEVEVEVFRFDRPARADLPLQASAHGPAGDKIVIVVVVAVEDNRGAIRKENRFPHSVADVEESEAALGIDQRRSPGIAEPACHVTGEAAVVVPVQGHADRYNSSTHGRRNKAIIVLVEGNSAEVDFDAVNEIRTEEAQVIPTLQVISELAAAKAVCGVEVSLPERELVAEPARHVTSGEHMVVQVQLRPSDPHMAAYIEPGPQRWRNIDWHVLQRAAFVEIRGVSCTSYANEGRDGRGASVFFIECIPDYFQKNATQRLRSQKERKGMRCHLTFIS